MSHLRILKQEFITGKITKDKYEILKENITDVLKDLGSKKLILILILKIESNKKDDYDNTISY